MVTGPAHISDPVCISPPEFRPEHREYGCGEYSHPEGAPAFRGRLVYRVLLHDYGLHGAGFHAQAAADAFPAVIAVGAIENAMGVGVAHLGA